MRGDLPPRARVPACRLAARLVHDVGKYVSRTARNVPEQGWTPDLAAMLCHDLFELAGGRASVVFENLAKPIEDLTGPQPDLARVRGLLAEIDVLESAVRQSEPSALDRAAQMALAVEKTLRAFARNLQEGAP
jgi:hypothetical protein